MTKTTKKDDLHHQAEVPYSGMPKRHLEILRFLIKKHEEACKKIGINPSGDVSPMLKLMVIPCVFELKYKTTVDGKLPASSIDNFIKDLLAMDGAGGPHYRSDTVVFHMGKGQQDDLLYRRGGVINLSSVEVCDLGPAYVNIFIDGEMYGVLKKGGWLRPVKTQGPAKRKKLVEKITIRKANKS